MEINSTINNKWRFCTFASFIGCMILLFCMNQGQDRVKLSTLPTMGPSMALYNDSDDQHAAVNMQFDDQHAAANMQFDDQHAAANMQFFLKPSNIIEYGKVVSEEEAPESCNIFDGKWVYDPMTSPVYNGSQCPFLSDQVSCQRNGRPDFEYQKWSWEAKGCKIPRFNGTDMLERLRGKRMIIVGDSLNRNQWESLACLLYSAIPSSQAQVHVKSGVYKVFRAKDHNCSVEFYWSPFLVELEENRESGSKILRLDKLSSSAKKWQGADIMVFNTGHWWVHTGKIKAWDLLAYEGKLVEKMKIESAFEIAMKTWAGWVDENVDKNNNTKVFFRSISTEHKGKQWCYNESKPTMDESYAATFPSSIVEIVERTVGGMRAPVRYLNITKLSKYRRDAHPTVYTAKQGKVLTPMQQRQPMSFADCSHWCLPGVPDTWNRLLYASLVFDNSTDAFIS